MKKIYIDVCLDGSGGRDTWHERREFVQKLALLSDSLTKAGFLVLDFRTPNLSFNPHNESVDAFVREADVVLVIRGELQSLGFSQTTLDVMRHYSKMGIEFMLNKQPDLRNNRGDIRIVSLGYRTLPGIVFDVQTYFTLEAICAPSPISVAS